MAFFKEIFFVAITLLQIDAQFLSCREVRGLLKIRKLNETDLLWISPKEMVKCLPDIRKQKLDFKEASMIWNAIVTYHSEISNISNEILSSLNWITRGIKPNDYDKIKLCDPEVIRNFGKYYNLSEAQLLAIARNIRRYYANKSIQDYTGYDLMNIKEALCVFNESDLKKIHPRAYKDAAFIIGRLKYCPMEAMKIFASLAREKGAFGPLAQWTKETICIMGRVAKYLSLEHTQELMRRLGNDILKQSEKNVRKENDCY